MEYLVLSDIHLGHRRNDTSTIVSNLEKFFIDYKEILSNLDIIILAGDVYDRLLSLPSMEASEALRFLIGLVRYCSRNNIKLRILEGTPSHDWKQCRIVKDIIDKLQLSIDFKYIDTILIEKLDEYNISILYVPDEYNPTTTETMEQIDTMLNGDIVDIAIVHGQFKYHLPIYKEYKVFDEQFFLDKVRYYIHVGHIHTFSTYSRIVTHGSFDRLSHGEEEAKGGLYVKITNTDHNYLFLENRHATIFRTIDTNKINTIKELDSILSNIPDNSHVRLLVYNNKLLDDKIALEHKYPNLHIKIKRDSKITTKQLLNTNIIKESYILNKNTLLTQINKLIEKDSTIENKQIILDTISKFL